MHLPDELLAKLSGRTLERIQMGESGAGVWRCAADAIPTVYLKAAPRSAALHLLNEAARLQWMHARGLPVPVVRDHGCAADMDFLIVDEVCGFTAADPCWLERRPDVVPAIGVALATLHAAPTAGCPFDHRIARQLEQAKARIVAGLVREDDFDEERRGRSAESVFRELVARVPDAEDVVFAHGDYCLPNILLVETSGGVRVSGMIDCGRAGLADRHQDLALAARSIARNYGDEWLAPFFAAYGLPNQDRPKLEFFVMLDEFF